MILWPFESSKCWVDHRGYSASRSLGPMEAGASVDLQTHLLEVTTGWPVCDGNRIPQHGQSNVVSEQQSHSAMAALRFNTPGRAGACVGARLALSVCFFARSTVRRSLPWLLIEKLHGQPVSLASGYSRRSTPRSKE